VFLRDQHGYTSTAIFSRFQGVVGGLSMHLIPCLSQLPNAISHDPAKAEKDGSTIEEGAEYKNYGENSKVVPPIPAAPVTVPRGYPTIAARRGAASVAHKSRG
jgi:hypothetical protein